MSKEQLHGEIENRQPGFTGGRKRNLAEVCAKFPAAQEAAKLTVHQPDCPDPPAKVMGHRTGPFLFLSGLV